MRNYSFAVVSFLLLTSPGLAFDSETDISVSGEFAEATDVSGIACADGMGTWPRNCLVAVDEGLSVQRATLTEGPDGYVLAAGDRLALLAFDDKKVEPPYFGEPPKTDCTAGKKDAKELDAEAATFVAGNYYITGSHGCGRNNHAARLSSFLVSRLSPDAVAVDGGIAGDISFRLNEVLAADPTLSAHFAKDLDAGGISIEGLAGTGNPARLYFGLRSPIDGSSAYVVSVDAAALFSADADLKAQVDAIDLSRAGPDMGIRDIATIEGEANHLLLLLGPALGEGGSFAVADYDLATKTLGPATEVKATSDDKAEAALLIDRLSTKAKVMFLFDGGKNGAPAIDIVPLQH